MIANLGLHPKLDADSRTRRVQQKRKREQVSWLTCLRGKLTPPRPFSAFKTDHEGTHIYQKSFIQGNNDLTRSSEQQARMGDGEASSM